MLHDISKLSRFQARQYLQHALQFAAGFHQRQIEPATDAMPVKKFMKISKTKIITSVFDSVQLKRMGGISLSISNFSTLGPINVITPRGAVIYGSENRKFKNSS